MTHRQCSSEERQENTCDRPVIPPQIKIWVLFTRLRLDDRETRAGSVLPKRILQTGRDFLLPVLFKKP